MSSAATACTHEGGDCPCVKPEPARPVRRAPAAPAAGPVARKLGPGETAWLCTCGQSSNYPFCNGAHRAFNAANGTSFSPMAYTNDKAEEVTACEYPGAGGGAGAGRRGAAAGPLAGRLQAPTRAARPHERVAHGSAARCRRPLAPHARVALTRLSPRDNS